MTYMCLGDYLREAHFRKLCIKWTSKNQAKFSKKCLEIAHPQPFVHAKSLCPGMRKSLCVCKMGKCASKCLFVQTNTCLCSCSQVRRRLLRTFSPYVLGKYCPIAPCTSIGCIVLFIQSGQLFRLFITCLRLYGTAQKLQN